MSLSSNPASAASGPASNTARNQTLKRSVQAAFEDQMICLLVICTFAYMLLAPCFVRILLNIFLLPLFGHHSIYLTPRFAT
ncbi:hypothetical protein F5Y02DRAFT_199759 [Annulohypoxylon stygium]|nr:hypothetical protein F5Y02DRAFT_199759 [Annulohypoxylon stygium]